MQITPKPTMRQTTPVTYWPDCRKFMPKLISIVPIERSVDRVIVFLVPFLLFILLVLFMYLFLEKI